MSCPSQPFTCPCLAIVSPALLGPCFCLAAFERRVLPLCGHKLGCHFKDLFHIPRHQHPFWFRGYRFKIKVLFCLILLKAAWGNIAIIKMVQCEQKINEELKATNVCEGKWEGIAFLLRVHERTESTVSFELLMLLCFPWVSIARKALPGQVWGCGKS